MQTRKALAMHRGQAPDWGDGPLSEIADQLVAGFREKEAARLDEAASRSALERLGPAAHVLARRVAQSVEQSMFDSSLPVATRFDFYSLLQRAAKNEGSDRGLRLAAAHARRIWERDPHGHVAVGDVARFRTHYMSAYPKTRVASIIDQELPKVGFNTLPVQDLVHVAGQIEGRSEDELLASYERVVRAHGLDSDKPEHIRARAYVRGLVNLADEESETRTASTTDTDVLMRTLAKLASGEDPILSRVGQMDTSGVDEHILTELELFIENTGALATQKNSIIENIKRRIRKGTYDPALAPKLWLYWVDAGAKQYLKEFDAPGARMQDVFPRPLRMMLAEQLAEQYYEAIMNGEYGPVDGKQAQLEDAGEMAMTDGFEDDALPPVEDEIPHDETTEEIAEVASPITGEPLVLELGEAADDELNDAALDEALIPSPDEEMEQAEGLALFGQLEDFMDSAPELDGGVAMDEGTGMESTTIEDPTAPGEFLNVTLTPADGIPGEREAEDTAQGELGMLPPVGNDIPMEASRRRAVAPPGKKMERLVKELKDRPDVDNPWAVAWSVYNEGQDGASKDARRTFHVYAIRDGKQGSKPIDSVSAISMTHALRVVAQRLAEVGGSSYEVRAHPEAFARRAYIVLSATNHLLVAEEQGTEFEPTINEQQPPQLKGLPEDGAELLKSDGGFDQARAKLKPDVSAGPASVPREAKALSRREVRQVCAQLGLTAEKIEGRLLQDEPVVSGQWRLAIDDAGRIELCAGKKVIARRDLMGMDDMIGLFMARVAAGRGGQVAGPKGVAPKQKVAAKPGLEVKTLYWLGCPQCGGLDQFPLRTAAPIHCAQCQTETPVQIVQAQMAQAPQAGFVLFAQIPGEDLSLNARRVLAAIREVVPDAQGTTRGRQLEVLLPSPDRAQLARVQNVLASRFGIQDQALRPKAAQALPSAAPNQEVQPTTSMAVSNQSPPGAAVYTPPTPAINPPLGLSQPPAPQVPAVTTPPQTQAPSMGVAVTGPAAPPAVDAPGAPQPGQPIQAFAVRYRTAAGQLRQATIKAADFIAARRVFASHHPEGASIVDVRRAQVMEPLPPVEMPMGDESAPPMTDAPDAAVMMDSAGGGGTLSTMAVSPEIKEAVGAAMMTFRNSGVDVATGIKQFQTQFKQLIERFGDESSPARQALGAEIVRAAQEAWTKPALLELAAARRAQVDENEEGEPGKLDFDVKVNTQQPAAVSLPKDVLGEDSSGDEPAVFDTKVNTSVAPGGDLSPTDMGGGEEDAEPKLFEPKPGYESDGSVDPMDAAGTSVGDPDLGEDSMTGDNKTTKKWDSISDRAYDSVQSK